ncbi:Tad domain-containing protein [Microbulbifer bruguierae]|uniref:Tad domain-containing protein n=1 Tax=Microbulbifer bruguierae TaxID=3029061 RepID=A0ABY8N955_9GAMM|nr:Tad domain-containing protein [Microbulbifer bruguierae]WGL15426.1 Tad domain-containing protein [Microbulbifer bruguierae]
MNRQRGNVIPYLVALMITILLAAQYVFNAYRITNETTRLQNTADAAAYSVANVYAQNHNFVALSNRALVANQITMAQVVTMTSWSRMLNTFAQTINDIGQFIPYVNSVTGYIENISNSVQSGIEIAAPVIAQTIGLYSFMVARQQEFATPMVTLIAQEILSEVIEANDPDVDYSAAEVSVTASTVAHLREFHGPNDCLDVSDTVRNRGNFLSSQRETVARCHQFRNVVMESRDGFSEARTYRFSFPGMPSRITLFGIPAEDVSGVPLWSRISIERAGETVLGGDTNSVNRRAPFTSWSAIDTISLHSSTRYWRLFRGTRTTRHQERVKLGVGHAYTGPENDDGHHIIHENQPAWRVNPRGSACTDLDYANTRRARNDGGFILMDVIGLNCNDLANDYSDSLNTSDNTGLQSFKNLRQEGYVEMQSPAFIYIRKSGGKIQSAAEVAGNMSDSHALDEYPGAADNAFHGAAGSAVFFRLQSDSWMRTDTLRRDRRLEFGNAYNPFWEPRLASMTTAQRIALRTAVGG